jgi:hypothetical protein
MARHSLAPEPRFRAGRSSDHGCHAAGTRHLVEDDKCGRRNGLTMIRHIALIEDVRVKDGTTWRRICG